MSGKVLLEHLFRAADRGVRVRLLLDDLGTMPSDATLLAIDSHPNIEVRMFNPVALRSPRLLGMVVDFGRINKRMHNKSFTADGQVSIVGGRNIGDEYFEAHAEMNFADLDVAVIGPVVKEVSDEFDLYWNNQSRFRSPRWRDKTRRPSSSPRSGRRSSRITKPRRLPPTRRACATVNLPGSSGIDPFPTTGERPRS